jgi:hypothetical protein
MHPLEKYLKKLAEDRHHGVPETSHYHVLVALLSEVGGAGTPHLHCVPHPKSIGAGTPDIALFGMNQHLQCQADAALLEQLPEFGVVEVKPVENDLKRLVADGQVKKYLDRYGQVLATNYREFQMVLRDTAGAAAPGERFSLASTEDEFWVKAGQPRKTAEAQGRDLMEFLSRVIGHSVPVVESRDLATLLAAYARRRRSDWTESQIGLLSRKSGRPSRHSSD